MKEKNITKILILALLTLLLIGIASATEHNNQTNTKTSTITKNTQDTPTITETQNNNKINKKTQENTKTAITKKKTTLTINYIPNTYYTDTVEISGKLSTKDKNLNSRPITLNINGKKVTRKTNEQGIYTYEYKTKLPGKNNITATYSGNKYYTMTKTTKTFKVTRMPTTLSVDNLSTSTIGNEETINGELFSNNYDPLKNTKINIYYNGGKKTVRTNDYVTLVTHSQPKKPEKTRSQHNT